VWTSRAAANCFVVTSFWQRLSLDLEAQLLDQGRPFSSLTLDVGGVLLLLGAGSSAASTSRFLNASDDSDAQILVEPLDNRARLAGRTNQAIILRRLEAGQARFDGGRHIGQRHRAFRTGDCDRTELSALHPCCSLPETAVPGAPQVLSNTGEPL
jgi:hypothetical protein